MNGHPTVVQEKNGSFFSRLFYSSATTPTTSSPSSSSASSPHFATGVASYSGASALSTSSSFLPSSTSSSSSASSLAGSSSSTFSSALASAFASASASVSSSASTSSSPSSSPSTSSSTSLSPAASQSPVRHRAEVVDPFASPAPKSEQASTASPFWSTHSTKTSPQATLPGMIRRVTNAAPPPIAINSPALKRNFDVDYGKSAELSPIRTVEPVAKTDEAASKERENSQLHKLEARFAEGGPTKISPVKVKKFNTLLSQPVVDIDALKRESWSGIPPSARDITWKLLLGYLPAKQDRREGTLERKRGDYMDSIPQYYKEEHEQTASEQAIWRQIYVDILRTHQSVALFQQEAVQKVLVRVLYLWAIRHPASSYVQGINELIIPFFVVFLSTAVGKEDVEELDFGTVPADVVSMVEADCYWCLSALLDDIQDHYTSDQPGIQRLIFKLKELIRRIDLPLHAHLEKQEVHFTLFAFKWMNCLLMRELPLALVTRMWDTYLSEPEGFSTFHVYVCASFLTMWSDHLRQLDFQDIVLFLHHVPTDEWTTAEVEMLLSKAYMLKALYHDSQAHLK